MITYLVAVLCVFGIAIGQILFKLSAASFKHAGSLYDLRGLVVLAAAFLLYGITTIGWVWVLRNVELGRAYPLMALAYVIVSILAYFALGERFNGQYVLGVVLIVIGIIVSVRA